MRTTIGKAVVRGVERVVVIERIGISRKRSFYNTLEEAEARVKDLKENCGSPLMDYLNLTPNQKDELAAAHFLSTESGISLITAMREAIKRKSAKPPVVRPPKTKELTLIAALSLYIDEKRQQGLRKHTIKTMENLRLAHTNGGLGLSLLKNIDRSMIRGWIESKTWSLRTRNNARSGLCCFYNWAVNAGITNYNPLETFPPYKPTSEDERRAYLAAPKILLADKLATLLRRVMDEDKTLIAYVALCFFAGLRPCREAALLSWDDIYFKGETNKYGVVNDSDYIMVGGWTTKNRQSREVPMPPVLREWLRLCRNYGMPLNPHNPDRRWQELRCRLGLTGENWQQDVARHTYASMHLMGFQNINATVASMGHGNYEMLFKHYRRVLPKSEALKFWELTPENVLDCKPLAL